jgi:hypothetical protein
MCVFALSTSGCGASVQTTPVTARPLPTFKLLDPAGKAYSRDDVLVGGLVMVVTAPTYSNQDAQEEWSEYLSADKPVDSHLVFVEDMDAAMFASFARSAMKNRYKPGQPIILLQDEHGDVPRALGVDKGATVVFVYDRRGMLVLSYAAEPSREAAVQIWQSLANAHADE